MTPPPYSSSDLCDPPPATARQAALRKPAPAGTPAGPAVADSHADDMRLLRRYVEIGSQKAFAELTGRHLPWIYAMCRRTLRDKHLAEDASQAVFVLLARRAGTLSEQTRVAGWLFNTTRFVLKDVRKSEGRYQRRQGVARDLARKRFETEPEETDRIDPRLQAALDDGLSLLGERDRQALLMHFYEGLTLPQMGDRLAISRDGAKKRVSRALARLRQLLGKRASAESAGGKRRNKGAAGLSILTLALLLRGRDAWALPADLFGSTLAAATVPGAAPVIIEQIASSVIAGLTAATHRLLWAVIYGQAAMVLSVAVWMGWPAGPHAPGGEKSGGAGRPVAMAKSAPARSSVGINNIAIKSGSQRRADGSVADGADETPEPPYRSGADDPDPDRKKDEANRDAPKMLSQDGGSARAGGGGTAGGAPQNGDGTPGSTYAGLPPVVRTYDFQRTVSGGDYRPAVTAGAAQPARVFAAASGMSGSGGVRVTADRATRADDSSQRIAPRSVDGSAIATATPRDCPPAGAAQVNPAPPPMDRPRDGEPMGGLAGIGDMKWGDHRPEGTIVAGTVQGGDGRPFEGAHPNANDHPAFDRAPDRAVAPAWFATAIITGALAEPGQFPPMGILGSNDSFDAHVEGGHVEGVQVHAHPAFIKRVAGDGSIVVMVHHEGGRGGSDGGHWFGTLSVDAGALDSRPLGSHSLDSHSLDSTMTSTNPAATCPDADPHAIGMFGRHHSFASLALLRAMPNHGLAELAGAAPLPAADIAADFAAGFAPDFEPQFMPINLPAFAPAGDPFSASTSAFTADIAQAPEPGALLTLAAGTVLLMQRRRSR